MVPVTDRQTVQWDVLNRYLAVVLGSHRRGAWSMGRQRGAASTGTWDALVAALVGGDLVTVTDSNMHTSCVYDVRDERAVLHVSTVLPYVIVWSDVERRFLDTCPDWATPLTDAVFSHLGSACTRTWSPYRDDEAERRITYFELLFAWIEGSDGPPADETVDPWRPPLGAPEG